PGEDGDEHDRDRDRQGQQDRDTDEAARDAGDRRPDEVQGEDHERPEIAPQHERADRPDDRDDRLRQRVQAVIRTRCGRRQAREERGVVRTDGRRYAPSIPIAISPCGKRAEKRRLSAPRIAKTMKNVSVLSIGSDNSPCLRTAVDRSSPACWNAATRRSVPEPVTPPNTSAEIGAEMIAEMIPHRRPATKTYAAPRSRRMKSNANRPRTAAINRSATAQPRNTKIGSGPLEPSAGGAKNVTAAFE